MAMRWESLAALIVMNEGSPVSADNTPQNSPGQATYSRSYNIMNHCLIYTSALYCNLFLFFFVTLMMSEHLQLSSGNKVHTALQVTL